MNKRAVTSNSRQAERANRHHWYHQPGQTIMEGSLKKGVAMAALAGALLIAKNLENNHTDRANSKNASVEAIKKADSISTSVFVIRPGVNLRSTPNVKTATTTDGQTVSDNKVTTVKKGKELVVNMPIESNGFIGFLKPGVDPNTINSLEQRAANTLWVDDIDVMYQDPTLITEYAQPTYSATGLLDIKVTSGGAIKTPENVGSTEVAVAVEQPANTFENFRKHQ